MHNLKEIRKNFDDFKNSLKSRFLKIDFNELKDLDIKNRNFNITFFNVFDFFLHCQFATERSRG